MAESSGKGNVWLSGPRSSADALRVIDDIDTSDLRNQCISRNQRYHNHVSRQHDDLSVGRSMYHGLVSGIKESVALETGAKYTREFHGAKCRSNQFE